MVTTDRKRTAAMQSEEIPDLAGLEGIAMRPPKCSGDTAKDLYDRMVFICSPYRPGPGDTKTREQEKKRNISMAKAACRMAAEQGMTPMAPHLFFPRFLDDRDPKERAMGIEMGLRCMDCCDEVWVIGDRVSTGMAAEISYAADLGIPIKCIFCTETSTDWMGDLLKTIFGEHTSHAGCDEHKGRCADGCRHDETEEHEGRIYDGD